MDQPQCTSFLVLSKVDPNPGTQIIYGHFASKEEKTSLHRSEGHFKIMGKQFLRSNGIVRISSSYLDVSREEEHELLSDDATHTRKPPSLGKLPKRHGFLLFREDFHPGEDKRIIGEVISALGPILFLGDPHPN